MQPEDTAAAVWAAVIAIFHDNELSCMVYIDTEYHAVVQGNMTVMQYCTRLKTFADQLRDLGQPVSEMQQVFNMLCGLGRQYHGAILHITPRVPLPTFVQARSFLLLEEHCAEQTARQQAAHALVAACPRPRRPSLLRLVRPCLALGTAMAVRVAVVARAMGGVVLLCTVSGSSPVGISRPAPPGAPLEQASSTLVWVLLTP